MTQPLRILLIDDNRSDRTLIIRELQQEFNQLTVQEIISSGEFNRAIKAGDFDAVITDFQLRWTTGLDILETVKQQYPHCPVIMFTSSGTEEIAVAAMKLGLDDYLVKEPNRYMRVPVAVRIALERIETQQRAALLEIRLQGLLNQVRIGIFRSTPDGTLLEANPAFLELLGVESLAQANATNLINIREYYTQLANLSPPQREEREVQLQRRDSTAFWALLTMTLNTVEGTIVIDGLLEDITERHQTERNQTVAPPHANPALKGFTAAIVQDLRIPLQTIQEAAQSLLENLRDTLDASHLESLQQIAASAQELNVLITDRLTN
jgi:PAS domain S-box-containing protein